MKGLLFMKFRRKCEELQGAIQCMYQSGMDFQLINPYEEGCKWEQTLEYIDCNGLYIARGGSGILGHTCFRSEH